MLKCQCPKCGAKAEMDNSAAGHQFACECGTAYSIPPAPPAGDFRVCMDCMKLNEFQAVICTGCGFNFVNNKKYNQKISSEVSPGKGFQWFKRIALIVSLLLVCGAGFLIYSVCTSSRIGVSGEAPLGVFQPDKAFNYAEFKLVEMKLPPKFKDCRGYQFARKKKVDFGSAFDHVFLLTDAGHRILAVKGNYSETIVATEPAEKTFFNRIRKEYRMPAEPDFQRIGPDGGIFKPTRFEAKWENDVIRYEHIHITNPGVVGLKSVGSVFITGKKNPVTLEDLSDMPEKRPQ